MPIHGQRYLGLVIALMLSEACFLVCYAEPPPPNLEVPAELNATQYLDFGIKKFYSSRYETAKECFRRAAKLEPASPAGKQASVYLKSLTPRYAVSKEAQDSRNRAWAMLTNRNASMAIPMFEECTRNYPKFEIPFYDLACIYLDQKNPELAKAYASKALAINPTFSNGWLAIGNAQIIEQNYAAAKESAEKALKCNPYSDQAKKMVDYLRQSIPTTKAIAR